MRRWAPHRRRRRWPSDPVVRAEPRSAGSAQRVKEKRDRTPHETQTRLRAGPSRRIANEVIAIRLGIASARLGRGRGAGRAARSGVDTTPAGGAIHTKRLREHVVPCGAIAKRDTVTTGQSRRTGRRCHRRANERRDTVARHDAFAVWLGKRTTTANAAPRRVATSQNAMKQQNPAQKKPRSMLGRGERPWLVHGLVAAPGAAVAAPEGVPEIT